MHGVAITSFSYGGTSYNTGDMITGSAFAAIFADPTYARDIVQVNDSASPIYTLNPGSTFNVKSFGAKGDSITDDTAAFQAAMFQGESLQGLNHVYPNPAVNASTINIGDTSFVATAATNVKVGNVVDCQAFPTNTRVLFIDVFTNTITLNQTAIASLASGSTINCYPVSSISVYIPAGCYQLRTVYLPDNVTVHGCPTPKGGYQPTAISAGATVLQPINQNLIGSRNPQNYSIFQAPYATNTSYANCSSAVTIRDLCFFGSSNEIYGPQNRIANGIAGGGQVWQVWNCFFNYCNWAYFGPVNGSMNFNAGGEEIHFYANRVYNCNYGVPQCTDSRILDNDFATCRYTAIIGGNDTQICQNKIETNGYATDSQIVEPNQNPNPITITTVSGSASATIISAPNTFSVPFVGQTITCAAFPNGTTVTAMSGSTGMTLSNVATATNAGGVTCSYAFPLTITTTTGSAVATVSGTYSSGIVAYQRYISSTAFPAGTTIRAFSGGTSITMNQVATSTGTSALTVYCCGQATLAANINVGDTVVTISGMIGNRGESFYNGHYLGRIVNAGDGVFPAGTQVLQCDTISGVTTVVVSNAAVSAISSGGNVLFHGNGYDGFGVWTAGSTHTIVNSNLFDQNFIAGMFWGSAGYFTAVGNFLRRNGRKNSGIFGQDAQIVMNGGNYNFTISANNSTSEQDDSNNGMFTPLYGMVLNGSNTTGNITSNNLSGALNGAIEYSSTATLANLAGTLIFGNNGKSPNGTATNQTSMHHVSPGRTLIAESEFVLTALSSNTIASIYQEPVYASGQTRHHELFISARNTSNNYTSMYTANCFMQNISGTTTITLGTFSLVASAGASPPTIGATGTTITVAAQNIGANGVTFDMLVTNTASSGTYDIRVEWR